MIYIVHAILALIMLIKDTTLFFSFLYNLLFRWKNFLESTGINANRTGRIKSQS